jgi:hypothetical protein
MSLRLRILFSWLSIALYFAGWSLGFVDGLGVPFPLWLLALMVLNWYLRAPLKNRLCDRIKPVVVLVLLIPPLLAAIALACSIGPPWLFSVASVPFVLFMIFASAM